MSEKQSPYENAHSGLPLVQHALPLMLQYAKEGKITLEKIARKMSHAVADCFQIRDRGYIREGYFADLAMVDLNKDNFVNKESLNYKCGWSPFEGTTFSSTIEKTFVSGCLKWDNGKLVSDVKGKRIAFNRN
jgi:dihydroorotase